MKVKLNHDDLCAIDLVLEQRAAGTVSGRCFGKPTASLQKRIKRVEQLFDLLGQLPAQEPPLKLVAGTLKHIRRHEHDALAGQSDAAKGTTVSHPMLHRPLQ
jgi:hypothetical protein